MRTDRRPRGVATRAAVAAPGHRLRLGACVLAAMLLAACGTPPRGGEAPAPAAPPPPAAWPQQPAPAPAPVPQPPAAPPPATRPSGGPDAGGSGPALPPSPVVLAPARPAGAATEAVLATALAHADRLRTLNGPELSAETARLAATSPSALRQVQLAMALMQGHSSAEAPRIHALLQAVLSTDTEDARSLHPLVRLLLAQQAHQRRLEEQLERQAQATREAQRRNEQLSERLEALRAIERSMPTRPAR